MKRCSKFAIVFILLVIASVCSIRDTLKRPSAISGLLIDGTSYDAYWKDRPRNFENLTLLVINEVGTSPQNTPAFMSFDRWRGCGLASRWDVQYGHVEKVVFEMKNRKTLSVLGKEIDLSLNPCVRISCDTNGCLSAEPVDPGTGVAAQILENILKTKEEEKAEKMNRKAMFEKYQR
ncbi:MAG: hypothetical protein FWG50_00520 [Kiritimatiellaeota bacterium]|nr:hypothetical protein [Kiritimatiellota bacterium]